MKITLDFDEKTIRFDSECKLTDIKTLQDMLPDWKTWRIVPQYTLTVTPNIYPSQPTRPYITWDDSSGTAKPLPGHGTVALSKVLTNEATDCTVCTLWGDSVGNML